MTKKHIYTGIALAVIATVVWSGNFIVARGVIKQIPPVSLAFYRWLMGSLIILPIGYRKFREEYNIIRSHWKYLFWVAFSGITLYNTFLYVAGHYTPAINLALIATTTSPIMAIALAAIFLKEKIGLLKLIGLLICISGILLLLSQGSLTRLLGFHFSVGDWWLLAGALCFAIYNTLVKRKPKEISATSFLVVIFWAGTIMLLPGYIWELNTSPAVQFDWKLIGIIVYLGLGACVISYLCWNAAIARLGAGRTALFGNLIPIFSTLEAVAILDEKISGIHLMSGALVIIGLVLANISSSKSPGTPIASPEASLPVPDAETSSILESKSLSGVRATPENKSISDFQALSDSNSILEVKYSSESKAIPEFQAPSKNKPISEFQSPLESQHMSELQASSESQPLSEFQPPPESQPRSEFQPPSESQPRSELEAPSESKPIAEGKDDK